MAVAAMVLTTPKVAHSFSITPTMQAHSVGLNAPKIPSGGSSSSPVNGASAIPDTTLNVAYKPLSISGDLGVNVPVACWFPVDQNALQGPTTEGTDTVGILQQLSSYKHRISIRRIAQLLARIDWIPEFANRNFDLQPASSSVADGESLPFPKQGPVVLLAHGYLGSRFDLSHLAENLAKQGFICFAPEYPESLAASFTPLEGLDRRKITDKLLDSIANDWNVKGSSFGMVGHSMGCGTAIETGDETWARVCIAGFPRQRDGSPIPGNVLFLSSMNDGVVSLERLGGKQAIPSDFTMLDESTIREQTTGLLPSRAALIFDRPDAPNHISFLVESVGNAMIDLLSPLLPAAQAIGFPVLDFDRYKAAQDSKATAEVVHPIVTAYLKQRMM